VLFVEATRKQQQVIEDRANRISELEAQNQLIMKEVAAIKRQFNQAENTVDK